MTTTTPNMNLILPDVSITAGPQWATLLNAAYALIDSHDHSSGKGALITPAGLNITSGLAFNQNDATDFRTVRLHNYNTLSLGASDKTCLYVLSGELHYVDVLGNDVQITVGGQIDVGSSITALSIKDSGFFVQYFGDITRQFRFNTSAIPTATTRILSVPDSGTNDTFVTQAATQTLTNKTLTTPVIASINTGSVTLALPAADGSSGQAIVTNGSAALSFATIATTVANVAANDSNVTFVTANNRTQICTPTAARTYTLPTTSIAAGDTWTFVNLATNSANLITLQSSAANTVDYVLANGKVTLLALVSTPTTAAHWKVVEATSGNNTYVPTYTGSGTVSNNNANYRRNGKYMIVQGYVTLGTVAASLFSATLPGSFTIDAAAMSNSVTTASASPTVGYIAGSAGAVTPVLVSSLTSTSVIYCGQNPGAAATNTPQNANGPFASGSTLSYFFTIPISQWGGN